MTATYRRNADAQAYFDSLTPEDILATLHANREARKAEGRRVLDSSEHGAGLARRPNAMHEACKASTGKAPYTTFDTLGLREGVALADRLIAAKGGKARGKLSFWEYLAEWEQGRDVLRPSE
jgi:hypothetical protein